MADERGALTEAPLAPRYYLENFRRLSEVVEAQYGDMLSAEERHWLTAIASCSDEAQCLLLRLLSRVGPEFRLASLNYPEIGALEQPSAELAEAGLLLALDSLSAEQALRLYTRAELLGVFAESLGLPRATSKSVLAQAMSAPEAELEPEPLDYYRLLQQRFPERIIAPLGADVLAVLQLLYFGNRRQSLTDFVLSDLGIQRYYPYQLDRARRRFVDRGSLDEYLSLAQFGDVLEEALEAGDEDALLHLAEVLAQHPVNYDSSRSRRDRLCNRLGRELERRDQLSLAESLYALSQRHPARERQLRILERRGDYESALRLADTIEQDPRCEAERDAQLRIRPRLLRQLGRPAPARPRDDFPRRDLCIDYRAEPVELLAAESLTGEWHQVHYVENSLFTGLFVLAFWEQIFAPIAGVWMNPYQDAPADLYEADFLARRASLFKERFQALDAGQLQAELLQAWDRYQGYRNRWLDWRSIDRALVATALEHLSANTLQAIWQRMLFDLRENRSGFPDLIAFGGEAPGWCLIEVKGPGDKLQDNQKRWLRFFAEHDIPCQVAWVTWRDD